MLPEATSLRAAVNKREQQPYQEYLTRRLRLKDTELELLHTGTPDGEEVGPLERGFTSATSPGPLSLRGLRLGGMVGSWVPRRRA